MKGKTFPLTLALPEFENLEKLCAATRRTKSNYLSILVQIAHLEQKTNEELLDHLHKLETAADQTKPVVKPGFWFTNEHNNEVTVLSVNGEWCMVEEFGKNQPYVLPLEFVANTVEYMEMKKNPAVKVTCKVTFRTIRIYINGIVHIIFPRALYRLQSWYEGDKNRVYKIELQTETLNDEYHYEDVEVWKNVLELLDENLQN